MQILFSWHTKNDDRRTIHQRGSSPATLSANVDSLCTSETRVTHSQKLSWLTHSDPQRAERTRQQGTQCGGRGFIISRPMMMDNFDLMLITCKSNFTKKNQKQSCMWNVRKKCIFPLMSEFITGRCKETQHIIDDKCERSLAMQLSHLGNEFRFRNKKGEP